MAPQEKYILLSEVHHRVRNNYKFCIACWTFSRHAESVRDVLRDSKTRVRSVALIHHTLYDSKNFVEVDYGAFLESLASAPMGSYGSPSGKISTSVGIDQFGLPIDTAVPCGLMANELITNAFKRGFPNGRRGEIKVGLIKATGGHITLFVTDDGIGLPDRIDTMNTDTLGLQLVALLADRLGGTLAISRSHPTECKLQFSMTK